MRTSFLHIIMIEIVTTLAALDTSGDSVISLNPNKITRSFPFARWLKLWKKTFCFQFWHQHVLGCVAWQACTRTTFHTDFGNEVCILIITKTLLITQAPDFCAEKYLVRNESREIRIFDAVNVWTSVFHPNDAYSITENPEFNDFHFELMFEWYIS